MACNSLTAGGKALQGWRQGDGVNTLLMLDTHTFDANPPGKGAWRPSIEANVVTRVKSR
jgi:hypothetical protein